MTGPFNRIIEGVAEIARKLGATVTDSGNRLADNIEGIAGAVGGGSGLPAVTAEDNGDVLTVVSGEWAKATPSGGGGVLIVGATAEMQDDKMTMTLDKAWQEIADAGFAVVKLEVPTPSEGVMEVTVGQVFNIVPPFAEGEKYHVTVFFMTVVGNQPSPIVYNFTADTANDYPVFSNGTK